MAQHTKGEESRLREAMLDALPRLRRFAWSLTGHRHDADDLMQATVERVLERAVPKDADVTRWMFKVCRNLWIDEVRARNVRQRAAHAPELADEPTVSGETTAIGELTLREVDTAMAALPDSQRAVVALVAVEGLTYREAAEVLETPIGTIMSRLARARAALATQFEARPAQQAAKARRTETTND